MKAIMEIDIIDGRCIVSWRTLTASDGPKEVPINEAQSILHGLLTGGKMQTYPEASVPKKGAIMHIAIDGAAWQGMVSVGTQVRGYWPIYPIEAVTRLPKMLRGK